VCLFPHVFPRCVQNIHQALLKVSYAEIGAGQEVTDYKGVELGGVFRGSDESRESRLVHPCEIVDVPGDAVTVQLLARGYHESAQHAAYTDKGDDGSHGDENWIADYN